MSTNPTLVLSLPEGRPLDVLLSRPELIEAIVELSKQGVFKMMEAFAEAPRLPHIAPNFMSWAWRCNYLTIALEQYGFVEREPGNLVQIESPEGYSVPHIRFMLSKGEMDGDIAIVPDKGPYTRALVEQNAKYNPQLAFDFDSTEPSSLDEWINIWVFTQLDKNNQLPIYVAVVGEMNERGNLLLCYDLESLGVHDMNTYEVPTLEDHPQSVINTPLLGDLPSTGT